MQALPSKCQDVAGMARRLGLTKEFQAGLLGIGQSLTIPVRLQPPQLGIRHLEANDLPPRDNWILGGTSRSAMYGKGGFRKERVAVQICRLCHPF